MKTLTFTYIYIYLFLAIIKINQINCYRVVERLSDSSDSCDGVLSPDLIKEIDSYQPIVDRIVNEATNGSFKGRTWRDLSDFVDDYGSRFTGTQNLEDAIDHVLLRSREFGLENVHGDVVPVPRWIRGNESATMLSPREKNLRMLGLGYSNGTGTSPGGITAEAIVVESFEELKKRASEVPGKIVVYNQKFISYGKTVEYRSRGAIEAAKLGAVATLIRSITPFSIYSPHTGMMSYSESVKKIPAACITVEDAHLLGRLAKRGKKLRINIKMDAHLLKASGRSRNLISEISGSTKPEKVVVVSGHVDSWDVGQGAMDDGGGAFSSWVSVLLLKGLGLQAKRTIRSIMWTAEEMGIIGANYYIKNGPDIENWVNDGVPGASLWNKNERYFWFHHSEGDTMDVEAPDNLDMATALFAATSYIIADINLDLPRNP
ncbi:Similar to cpq: Carboxypeptidase Q (Xenopus laevis) [Cotesia congregata]|uniref:Carboxypeptidase Q n=1 Tax=Cotesia congregata TaxID=51543 RepID=A0A8J2EHL0_COTCN|nr:Similar to cpq: Carboxypeptidase Q (Xenopus laevis) [Cotesia congregata]